MRPLADIRVVEVAENMCGPLCASYLGDLGADVVKVELLDGDRFRRGPEGLQLAFLSNNRSKRSAAIDFKKPEGLATLQRLTDSADIFIDAARPGVADRRGYGWETLRKRNDRLIYCTITGFGPDGPYSHKPSPGVIVQALAGALSLTGSENSDSGPQRLGPPMECWAATVMGVMAILAALYMRTETGLGQKVDVSVFDSLINTFGQRMLDFPVRGSRLRPRGSKHFWMAPHKTFKTKDGHITIAVQEEERWKTFCEAIEKPELLDDARFLDNETRLQHEDELYAILDPLFLTKSALEWNEILERAHQYVGIVQTSEQLFTDPQALHDGILVDVPHPDVPGLKMINTGIRSSAAEIGINRRPPRLGEHTIEVLTDWGLTSGEIDALVQSGVAVQAKEGERVVVSDFGHSSAP